MTLKQDIKEKEKQLKQLIKKQDVCNFDKVDMLTIFSLENEIKQLKEKQKTNNEN